MRISDWSSDVCSSDLPGSAYQYTNSGYSLLAEVVRRASGQRLRVFCEDRIFRPLGMSHTHFQDKISDIVPERALSYTPTGKGYARQFLSYATAGRSEGLCVGKRSVRKWKTWGGRVSK